MSSLGASEERREDANYHRLGDAAHECTGEEERQTGDSKICSVSAGTAHGSSNLLQYLDLVDRTGL